MPYLLIAIVLGSVLLLIWVLGLIFGFAWPPLALASGGVTLLTALGTGAGAWWRWKSGGETADGTAAARAAVRALHARWKSELPALRTVQAAGKALIDQPWWLVVGATGAGKTRMLQDSGMAFISNATRPAGREPVPTESFDWWCTADAAFLDTAGRLLTDPRAQPEWRHLLGLIRGARNAPAVHGVLLCLDVGALLTKGKGLAAEAQALRERLDEATALLGVAVPLYVVFTKADSLGGFKDFAACLRRSEKEQVLGATLTWPLPEQPAQAWPEEHKRLVQALQSRRLPALASAPSDEVVRKLFQFPIQFQAAGRFVQEFIDALCRPGLHPTAPLRGLYFTSCFHAQRLDTGSGLAARDVQSLDKSVFLAASQSTISGPTAVQEVLDDRLGFFVRGLLTRVLPADRDLAQPTGQARVFARQLRWLCLGAAPLAAGLALLWISVIGWRQTSLISETRTPAEALREVAHNAPTDVPRNLEALDRLGDRLTGLLRADNGRLGPAIDGVTNLYVGRLRELLLDPCVAVMTADLARLRTAPGATVGKGAEQDALYDLFRSYQMLTGAVPPEGELLTRTLLDQRRWYQGIERGGKTDYHTEQLAKRQLELLPRLLAGGRARVDTDRRLVDAITKDLGEALWLRRGYDDLLRSVNEQFPQARAELQGGDQSALETTHAFTLVYSQRGWDEAIRRGIDEKAQALERTFKELNIALPRGEIARRLTELFTEDHRRQWLTLLATPRAAGAKDIRDVPELITRLAGKGSPYPDFAKGAIRQLDLRISTLQLFATGEDFRWIEPALRALGELRKDVEAFIATTEPLARSKDPSKVKALAERYNAVSSAITEALSGIQPEDKRTAVHSGFDAILHSLWLPLDRSLAEELDSRWGAQVANVWADTGAKRFPFAKDASEELPLATLAKFLNPVSGALWGTVTPIETLRAATVVGHPGVTLDPAYEALLVQARDLRELLFAGNSETVQAPFTLTLIQREGIEDIAFGIGSQGCTLYQRPDFTYTLALRQNEPPTVKVAIRILKGQWRPQEFSQQPWGLLRLLRAGTPTLQDKGGYLLTWPFETAINGKPTVFKACAELKPTGFEKVAFGDAFTAFNVPRRILPAREK